MKILILLCTTFLFSCGRDPAPHSGALRIANGAEPQSLDPHKCTGVPGIRIIGAMFEGLVSRNENGRGVRPGVAQRWEVSGDGTLYTFHLRKTFWSNGDPLIAGDFVRSWQRLLNPATGAEYASLLDIIRHGPDIISGKMPLDSAGLYAPDDSTFIVKLRNPTGYFLDLCAFEPLFPVPVSRVSSVDEEWTKPQNIVCNGPFLLKTWKPNILIELNRNPAYWDTRSVKQENLHFLPIDHQETAYKMYLNGELDWLFAVPLNRIQAAKSLPDYQNYPLYGVYYYALNVTKKELQNPLLRKALAYSIDRKKIVDLITKGGQIPASGFVPIHPAVPYKGPGLDLFNPDYAKKCFRDAGYSINSPPPRLQILYNTSEDHKKVAEVISQMWKKELNIDVELLNFEWKVWLQTTKNLEHTIARASWIADYPDPYSFLELGVTTNGNNRTGYSNPVYDECIGSSQSILQNTHRLDRLSDCEKILLEDMPVIPIYYYTNIEMRNPDIQGAQPNPTGMYSWKAIHLR